MAGNPLPIRIEAIRTETDRHAFGEELVWRIILIDEVFVEEMNKQNKAQAKKGTAQKR